MSAARTRLQVFVASPGDTVTERDRLAGVVAELNRGVADQVGLVLELVRWETHSWPGVGADGQDVINQQIAVPDILVGIFWSRLGTPTQRAASGTVEEVERALAAWEQDRRVEVLVYFNQAPLPPVLDGLEQLRRLLEFRDWLQGAGLLVGTFNGPADFEARVRADLTQVVRRWPGKALPGPDGSDRPAARADDPEAWRAGLRAGELDVTLRGGLGRDAYALLAVLAEVMGETGFRADTINRAKVCFTEALNWSKRHSLESYQDRSALVERITQIAASD